MHDDETVRDLFAGHAMAGLVSKMNIHDEEAIAAKAYSIADAMMAERLDRNIQLDRIRLGRSVD